MSIPVWQVALVLNLTFAVGLGLGYAGWGRLAEAHLYRRSDLLALLA